MSNGKSRGLKIVLSVCEHIAKELRGVIAQGTLKIIIASHLHHNNIYTIINIDNIDSMNIVINIILMK